MKYIILILAFFTIPVFSKGNITLKVNVKGIESNEGELKYLLHNSEKSFPGKREFALDSGSVKVKSENIIFKIGNLKPGEYAVSVYHDEDGDGELDRNFIGIPSEDVGSSNDAPANFGPPDYEDAKFLLNKDTTIIINLN